MHVTEGQKMTYHLEKQRLREDTQGPGGQTGVRQISFDVLLYVSGYSADRGRRLPTSLLT